MKVGLVLVLSSVFGVGTHTSFGAERQAPLHRVDGSYVKEWLILGPFPSADPSTDFLAEAGGERNIRPAAGDRVRGPGGAFLAWKSVRPETEFISFLQAIGSHEKASAYAYCELESDEAGEALFDLAVDAAATLWINGNAAGAGQQSIPSNLATGTARFAAPLLRGPNRCLVKVAHGIANWELALRILPPHRGMVTGKVTDPGGGLLGNATIQLFQNDREILQTKSDADGQYQIDVFPAGGAYNLRGTLGGRGTWQTGLTLRPGQRQTIDLRLTDAVSISGAVLTLDGKTPQASVPVQAMKAAADGAAEELAAAVLTDAKGEYQFVALQPGRYRVRCHTPQGLLYYRITGESERPGRWLEVGERSYRGIDFRTPHMKKGSWRSYTTYDGLPNNRLACIEHRANGLLLLGSRGGRLCEFDGAEFKLIDLAKGMDGGVVISLRITRDGSIWFGTSLDGVTLYDWKTSTTYTEDNGLADNHVNSILVDRHDWVWFGTGFGISVFDGHEFTNYRAEQGLPGNVIWDLFEDAEGWLWAGTGGGAAYYDGQRFVDFPLGLGLANRDVYRIRQSRDGAVWFATSQGVVRYKDEARTRLSTRDGLASDRVNDILETQDGTLWFATDRGVSRYNGRTFVNYTATDGLTHDQVNRIHATPDGFLWFATPQGLARLDPEGLIQWTDQDGLIDREGNRVGVTCIDPTPREGLWFGTGAGAFLCDGLRVERVGALAALASLEAMHRTADGTLWLGNFTGLWKYDGQQLQKALEGKKALTLGHDAAGNIWFGDKWAFGGVSRFNPATGEVRNFRVADGLPHDEVRVIRPGEGDSLWLGGYAGLFGFDGNRFVDLNRGLPPEKIKMHAVWAIHIDEQGTLWTGGSGGLTRRKGNEVAWLYETKGLPRFRIWSMAQSKDGILWLGTETHGLVGYDGRVFTTIDTRDGVAGKEIHAVSIDAEGQIWAGAADGGLTRLRRGTRPPGIRLLSVEIEDTLCRDFSEIPDIPAGHRLTVQFHEIDFKTLREKRQFVYRVTAADGSTITNGVTNERRLGWTPRKGGAYVFEVRAVDRDLNYSAPERLELRVIPFWYQNAWIAVPAGTGALGLLFFSVVAGWRYAVHRSRANQLHQQMLRQERKARESLEESNRRLAEAKEMAEQARAVAEAAKEASELANRSKSTFLANMSHEIRTPLNAILGYAQILQRDDTLPEHQRQAVATIERSGNHLLALINEILDLSKIESGRMDVSISDFDLTELIKSVAMMFALRCRQKGLQWQVEWKAPSSEFNVQSQGSEPRGPKSAPPSADMPNSQLPTHAPLHALPVRGDDGKLRQVLINLLGNAVKFTEHGRVTLRVERRADDIYGFQVQDTGPGISRETQERIFEAFTQGDEGKDKGGTGLGLAISRRQVELMGGELRLESELGKGSCFRFVLHLPPALAEPVMKANLPEKRVRRMQMGCKVRALVVDDVADNRNVLRQFLESLGVQARAVSNGQAACEELGSRPYDIAFLDIQMPGMSGIEVAERVLRQWRELMFDFAGEIRDPTRAASPAAPPSAASGAGVARKDIPNKRPRLVAISASVLSHEQSKYAEIGFDGFVPKPFRFEQICECLETLIGVKFEYEAETTAASAPEVEPEAARVSLPAGLLAKLRRAAEVYSVTEFESHLTEVEALGGEGRSLAARLRELSRNVQIDEILAILNQVQTEP